MKNIRNSMLFFLVLALIISFTGCKNSTSSVVKPIDGEAMTENTLPISEEGITLTMWCQNKSQGYVKSYNDYEAFKLIGEKTGVNINFIHPTGAGKEQLHILLASGDYPDIIRYYFGNDYTTLKAYRDGVFIELDEYIDKYAPNFKKIISENESYKEHLNLISENILCFPILRDDERFMAYDGYFMRQDWLDKVGLSVPETIEEWETVLKAFRDNDLAGGGKTVPFATSGTMHNQVFCGAFGLASYPSYFLNPVTKRVTHHVLEPEFKNFLTLLNKWYMEGLLDKNFFSASMQQLDSMMLNGVLGSVYIDNNNSIPKYMQSKPDLDLVAVPFPKDKDGNRYHPQLSSMVNLSDFGAVITSACKYPVEAVRFFDYLYTKEASDLMYWGVEGESYTIEEDGTYKFTDLIINNADGKTPYEAINKYMTNTGFPGLHQYQSMVALEANFHDKLKATKNQSVEYSMQTDKTLRVPSFPLTLEELEETNRIDADLNIYLSEMIQKFIAGYEPLSNFDEFVSQAKQLGIERAIEIRQNAYDRAYKNDRGN